MKLRVMQNLLISKVKIFLPFFVLYFSCPSDFVVELYTTNKNKVYCSRFNAKEFSVKRKFICYFHRSTEEQADVVETAGR